MYYEYVILGAGLGGLGMGLRLKELGEASFLIAEKSERVGGTWRANCYPGSACDVHSHLYWYSFDKQPNWSRAYPSQPEILANIERLVKQHDLESHIRTGFEIIEANWNPSDMLWTLRSATNEIVTARFFIAAWGQLNNPKVPEFKGVEDFAGEQYHSARWDASINLKGKRVAIIGNGATAVQVVPAIADDVVEMTVFQRSASYITRRDDRPYSEDERKAYLDDPKLLRAARQAIYWERESRFSTVQADSSKSAEQIRMAREHLERQVTDPVLREKLWPDYPIGCKRILRSDDFYPAMDRENVHLVTERIDQIEPKGIRSADGTLHEVDVIIWATGFNSHAFQGSTVIRASGLELADVWSDGPKAYLGMTVSGFPNMLMIYGPNTNLGHNSIITMMECQYDYILAAVDYMNAKGIQAIDVKSAVLETFDAQAQHELANTAWAGSCMSWYKMESGRIVNNWKGSVEDYKLATAVFNPTDYELLSVSAPQKRAERETAL